MPRANSQSSGNQPPSIDDLLNLRLFKEVPRNLLLVLEGKLQRRTVAAGETILELARTEQPLGSLYFLMHGQAKVIGLDEDARVKPLNFLRKGEFFVDKSFSWQGQVATKVVAITHVELLILPRDEVRSIMLSHAPLQEKLRDLSDRIDLRNRIYSEDRYARSVLEFLIDNELTQASRVKITQMDKCIECDVCYDSCQERHGFQRLERGYAHFGILDFAKSCITCFYPTCIPACPVDSVIYNVQKGEVEILDNCIGCSACAYACQYGAIKMYKVDAENPRFARFLEGDRKIVPKQIADKCNHCDGYEDMVCITSCPTAAIIEVEASDLLENPRIFGTGAGGVRPSESRLEESWLEGALQSLYLWVGGLIGALLIWEALTLRFHRDLSVLATMQLQGWIPQAFSLDFHVQSDLCAFLGNLGFSFIALCLVYPVRRAFPRLFKNLGRQPMWLDFHNFCGSVGAMLVIFHTGLTFPPRDPGAWGFVALGVVVISGIFGRFLYQMIPRGVAGSELKVKEIEQEETALSRKLEALFEDSAKYRASINKLVKNLAVDSSTRPTFGRMVWSVLKTRMMLKWFRFRLPADLGISTRQLGVFFRLLERKLRLQRSVAFLDLSSRLFIQWRRIHRPVAWVFTALVICHVLVKLFFVRS